jgi:hypothetical protein
MRNRSLLIFIIFTAVNVFAQKRENSEIKKNTLYFEFYQPIQTPSMREFYNDEWLLTPSNKYSRHYFSNSIGLCFEREFKNNIILRPRLGITIRKVKETNATDLDTNNSGSIGFPPTSRLYEEKYTYNQNHINIFLGVAKRFTLINRLKLDIGVDLTTIIYLSGKTDYYSVRTTYLKNTENIVGEEEYWWTNKVGKAYCIGIGPYIKPTYYFSKNIAVSLEVQMFFTNTFSKDKSTFDDRYKYWVDESINNGLAYSSETKSKSETKYDFSQWSWSRLSPLIRIGYNF